jgi:hypothetical protein
MWAGPLGFALSPASWQSVCAGNRCLEGVVYAVGSSLPRDRVCNVLRQAQVVTRVICIEQLPYNDISKE